jgi:hypothetical protein
MQNFVKLGHVVQKVEWKFHIGRFLGDLWLKRQLMNETGVLFAFNYSFICKAVNLCTIVILLPLPWRVPVNKCWC